jgi:HEAT repeat protein
MRAAARLAWQAEKAPGTEVRCQALALAKHLLGHAIPVDVHGTCCEIIRAGLRDQDPAIRLEALRLTDRPRINLVDQAALLLRDPIPEIRRAAMLTLGCQPSILATDDLLVWLHDPDPEVRHLCEMALQGRGLRDEYIELGRFLTDEKARNRLQILDYLRRHADLEPGVWLRRLTHDPVPAVRAAALRAAADQQFTDLTDRMEQMVQNDPSPTVRQVAQFYLSWRKTPRY